MNPKIKARLKRSVILAAAAMVVGAGMGYVQVHSTNAIVKTKDATPMAGISIGGPFELTDQNGDTVTDKSFPDKYKLVYFGFSSCPAICPTELKKMTNALQTLGANADKIQPVFITVDPGRDSPAVLKTYLELFDKRFVGLTGPKEKIDVVMKNFKIYAAKQQDPNATEYTMDHSSFIYLLAPNGELLSIYRTADTAEHLAKDMGEKI